jgi:hypothetical protein
VDTRLNFLRQRIAFPCKQRSKGEVLNDGELGQHFCVVHLDHALVDLRPSRFDAGYVEQDGAMLPEWPLFDIVDESNSAKVHVASALPLDSWCLCHVSGVRGRRERALGFEFNRG